MQGGGGCEWAKSMEGEGGGGKGCEGVKVVRAKISPWNVARDE